MIAPCEENRDEGRHDNPPLVLAFEEEQSEDKVIAAYKKQNEKAVKAINKLYK